MENAEENSYPPTGRQVRDKLLEQRKIMLWGVVDDNSSKAVVEQLLYLDAQQHAPIHLFINSPGGMVTAGYAIYDMMRAIVSPVYTYCSGFASQHGLCTVIGW